MQKKNLGNGGFCKGRDMEHVIIMWDFDYYIFAAKGQIKSWTKGCSRMDSYEYKSNRHGDNGLMISSKNLTKLAFVFLCY